MANFTTEQVNTSHGFFGTMANEFGNVSRTQVLGIYNHLVDMLGDDPERARQFLDATEGRKFVDALTFLVNKETAGLEDIIQAFERSKTDRNTAWFWKKYPKFRKYESVEEVVGKLLES
jgi:hypothetical protein